MKNINQIIKEEINKFIINEINHVALNSNITVSSLSDFYHILDQLGINEKNVDQYYGQYAFIEIGSGINRLTAELPHIPVEKSEYYPKGNFEDPKFYHNIYQYFFKKNHRNVLRLEFDDNIKLNDKADNTTGVNLRGDESRSGNRDKFRYKNANDYTVEMGIHLQKFVQNQLKVNPNVKFIIHCKQGQSRSAAVGMTIAKIEGIMDDEKRRNDFFNEYDLYDDDARTIHSKGKWGNNLSQFRIGIGGKKEPQYANRKVMDMYNFLQSKGADINNLSKEQLMQLQNEWDNKFFKNGKDSASLKSLQWYKDVLRGRNNVGKILDSFKNK